MKYFIALALVALMLCFSSVTAIDYTILKTQYYNSTNCADGTLVQPVMYSNYQTSTCNTNCQQISPTASAKYDCFESKANITVANDILMIFDYSGDSCDESKSRSFFSIPINTCVSGDLFHKAETTSSNSVKTSGCNFLNYYSDSDCTVLEYKKLITDICSGTRKMTCKTSTTPTPQNSNRNVEKSVMNNALTISMNSMLLISLLIAAFLF